MVVIIVNLIFLSQYIWRTQCILVTFYKQTCLPHQKYSWKLIFIEGHRAQHGGSQASPSGCKKDSESCCTEISPSPVQMVRLASQAQEPGKSPCSQCFISCLAPSERAKLPLVTLSEFTLPVLLLFCHLAITTFVQSWLLSKVSDAVSGLTWICTSLQLLNCLGCSLSVSTPCLPLVARAFQSIALCLFHIIPRGNTIF